MTRGTATEAQHTRAGITSAVRAWPPLALALGCAAAYGVFLALPFYANHLNRYPAAEVASGLHDPKDLWPYDTALGYVLSAGELF